MKNKVWRPILALAMATALLLSLCVFVSADRQMIWGHTDGLSGEDVMQKLHQLPIDDFLHEFDVVLSAAENGEGNDLSICWLQVCIDRAGEISDNEIIDRVYDNLDDVYGREWWAEIYSEKYPDGGHNDPRFLALLADPATDPAFKRSLLVELDFNTQEEIDTLYALTQDADADLRFSAINRLYRIDQAAAVDLAEAIMQGKPRSAEDLTQGAIDILAQELARAGGSREEKDELIALCRERLSSEGDQKVKDSIVYAMQMLGDLEALRMVVHHPHVDDVMKKGMIDNNSYLLEELLRNQPDQQDVAFVVECMELLPVKDLYGPLKSAIEAMPQALDADRAGLNALLDTMLKEGVDAKAR